MAAHHAGLLPVFKECVEQLYVRGLCKVVFATETLALGINMPARTVVIEKLVKFNGETHADITPGEYTQLTGRAGRRGLDVEGHGVVLWQPGMNPGDLAGLASTRTYPLTSSFRPSYNMAVNLVHQFGRARSRELLEMSFAQFQADQAVVGLARQLRKAEDALDGYAEAATCHLGDFMEYAALRRSISEAEKGSARARRADRREEVLTSLALLRPGDVIEVPSGKFAGLRGGGRPGHHRARAAALRADRGAPGAPARGDRLPDPGARAGQGAGAAQLQRPQPAGPPRPRLGAARQDPRPGAAAAQRRARAQPRAARRSPTRWTGCAPGCASTPATRARTARTTRAGPSAGSSWTATPTRCAAGSRPGPTPSPGPSTGSATSSPRSATSWRRAARPG